MTIGLPRSGKSTWAKTQGFPIVNADSIRLALHGQPFVLEAEELVHTIAQLMVRSLFLAGHLTIILDETNINRKSRDKWISGNWTRSYKLFDTSIDICLDRAKETSIDAKHLEGLSGAIVKMNKEFELPQPEEKFINNKQSISTNKALEYADACRNTPSLIQNPTMIEVAIKQLAKEVRELISVKRKTNKETW